MAKATKNEIIEELLNYSKTTENKYLEKKLSLLLGESIDDVFNRIYESEPIASSSYEIVGDRIVKADYVEKADFPSEENKVITFEVEGNTPFGYRKNPPQEVEFEETWDSIFNDIENWNELVIPHCDIVKKYLEDIYNVPSKKQ